MNTPPEKTTQPHSRGGTTPRVPLASILSVLFLISFLALCSATWIDFCLPVNPDISLNENRQLSEFPKIHLGFTALSQLPAKLEAYFNDHFGFRDRLIKFNARLMLEVFRTPANPAVILGKEDWLFLAGHYGLEYYQTKVPFTTDDLEHWKTVMEGNRNLVEARGSRCLIVIAPNKDTVYPEYMADNVVRFHETSRLDQLMDFLAVHSDLPVLDLREALIPAKGDMLLYDRSDTHWNGRGAYVAYSAILERIQRWFPQVEALPEDAFEIRTRTGGGDLIAFLGLSGEMTDQITELDRVASSLAREVEYPLPAGVPTDGPPPVRPSLFRVDNPALPRVVVFHDSFGLALRPLLAENFRSSLFIPEQYIPEVESPASILDRERPDMVIFLMVERSLQWPVVNFQLLSSVN